MILPQIDAEDALERPGRLDFQIANLQREVYLLRRQLASLFKDCGWKVPKGHEFVVRFDLDKGRSRPVKREADMTAEEYAAYRKRQVGRDRQVWCAALGLKPEG